MGPGGAQSLPGWVSTNCVPQLAPCPTTIGAESPRRVPGQMPLSLLDFSKCPHTGAGGFLGDLAVVCSWGGKGGSKGRRMLVTLPLFWRVRARGRMGRPG